MLDTLRYSKRLQGAGVGREQADAQAEALKEELVETVATKAQLEGVEQRLGGELQLLRSDLAAVELRLGARIDGIDTKIGSLASRMDGRTDSLDTQIKSLRWMIGLSISLGVASIGMTAAILAKLLLA